MATKKTTEPAAKSAPAKKATGTALVKWDERLAAKASAAKKIASQIGGGAKNTLSFKGGKLTYQGGVIPGNALEIVVLMAVNENNYFEGRYDPNNPASPKCYAFGSPDGDDENMGPDKKNHFKGREGDVQSETGRCADCEHNQWGSAETGRGKACKNVVSLAMISADCLESEEKMAKAEVFYAKLPVTSGKSWKGLVNDLGDKHFVEYVLEIRVTPSGETYTVDFEPKYEIEKNEVFGMLIDLSDKEERKPRDPYPVFDEPAPQRGRGRTIPIKAAPAKKAVKPAARKY